MVSETAGPLSVLFSFPALFLDEAGVDSALRITLHQPVLVHRETQTCCTVFGLGAKFRARFSDGTILVTANLATQPINDNARKFYEEVHRGSIADAWAAHRARVAEHQARGLTLARVSLNELVEMERAEDAQMALSVVLHKVMFLAMLLLLASQVYSACQ